MLKTEYEFNINKDGSNLRLDVFIAKNLRISRNKAQKLIEKEVVVNNKTVSKHYKLKIGDVVIITNSKVKNPKASANHPKIRIIEERKNYLIIDKPSGLVVHPDNIHPKGTTLIDQVVALYPDIAINIDNSERPGVVHRLDKNVSGVMVVARNKKVFDYLKNEFKKRKITKKYLALVHGKVEKPKSIRTIISRSKSGRMVSTSEGRQAETFIKPIRFYTNCTLLEINILTGRTHQIKLHTQNIDHPIVGERVYTNRKVKSSRLNTLIGRPFLHSHELGFTEIDGEKVLYKSSLPDELEKILKSLTKSGFRDSIQ